MSNFELTIESDSDSFISYECPYCKYLFKLKVEEIQTHNFHDLYCPSCGLIEEYNSFLNSQIRENALEIATAELMMILSKQFGKSLIPGNVRTKSIEDLSNITDQENEQEIVMSGCCEVNMKIDRLEIISGFYCFLCGRYNNGIN